MNWLIDYPYFRWHLFFVIVPSLALWLWRWRYLLKYKKTIAIIAAGALVWGFVFDIVASPVLGLWFFSHNSNIYWLGLPLEEYLFLLFVPQLMAVIFLLLRKEING